MTGGDRALVLGMARGDGGAIARAYDDHANVMYSVAMRLTGNQQDAEDVVHDAFLRAVRAAGGFRGESTLRTWLVGIVVNRWRETRRGADRMETLTEIHAAPLEVDPSQRLDLEKALSTMPAGYREVVVLHDVEGFTHQEIGGMLGIEPGTSKSQLARGRAWLRRALKGEMR